jgi:YesN/AraC family two-component response regulator
MLKSADSEISILIIENDDFWVNSLTDSFKMWLRDYADIETVSSYNEAIQKITEKYYHLITLDLEINGPAGNKFPGNDLLETIREKDSPNFNSGLIIVTGYGTKKNLKKAIGSRYRVDEVILKENYESANELIEASKTAIFDSLVKRLNEKKQIILNLSMNSRGSIAEIELKGIKTGKRIPLKPSVNFNLPDFSKAADDIQKEILSKPTGAWRHKAKKTGTIIYEKLISHPQLSSLLSAGRQESKRTNNQLHLQLTSPAKFLNLPIELMFEKDYQVFDYIFSRRLAEAESDPTSFSDFVREIYQANQPLKVLVVGANLSNPKYNCEKEARIIGELIEKNLNILGIRHSVKVLASAREATYENLVRNLQNGCHILHFAGHSNHLASLPEESRVDLYDRSLKAIDLKALLKNKQTQFVFLNSCLGARMGNTTGKGGYWGFMDSLGAAGIPAVLGYRWLVDDQSAFILAYYFYENLFRSFSFAESLFRARNQASVEIGRDYEVWASPVLLTQNL